MQVMLSESSYETRSVHPVADPNKETAEAWRWWSLTTSLPPHACAHRLNATSSLTRTLCPCRRAADTHLCRVLAAQAGLFSPKNFSAPWVRLPPDSQKILYFCCLGTLPLLQPTPSTGLGVLLHPWLGPSPSKHFPNTFEKMMLTETHANSSASHKESLPVRFQWKKLSQWEVFWAETSCENSSNKIYLLIRHSLCKICNLCSILECFENMIKSIYSLGHPWWFIG